MWGGVSFALAGIRNLFQATLFSREFWLIRHNRSLSNLIVQVMRVLKRELLFMTFGFSTIKNVLTRVGSKFSVPSRDHHNHDDRALPMSPGPCFCVGGPSLQASSFLPRASLQAPSQGKSSSGSCAWLIRPFRCL